jgi:hypothetical protein
MTGNVVISEVDALRYVVLSKAEKHMPYGELGSTTEVSHKPRSLLSTSTVLYLPHQDSC